MNTARLRQLLEFLLKQDDELGIQKRLTAAQQALNNLTGAPADPNRQMEAARAIDDFELGLSEMQERLTPVQEKRVEELGGLPYFTPALALRLKTTMSAHAATPAAIQAEATTIAEERARFLELARTLVAGLDGLDLGYAELEAGEAEVGFEVPREIFHNELGEFSKELAHLKFIVRAFSEVAGNAGETIELRQLSTTDPLIIIGVGIVTVRYIAKGVSWALDQWKTVEEIRHIRAQTAALSKSKERDSALKLYDKMIEGSVDSSARNEANRLAAEAPVDAGRRKEVETHVFRSLLTLLHHIERGMIVELRLGPPPPGATEEGNESAPPTPELTAYQEVQELQQQLAFPAPVGEPLLSLPELNGEDGGEGAN